MGKIGRKEIAVMVMSALILWIAAGLINLAVDANRIAADQDVLQEVLGADYLKFTAEEEAFRKDCKRLTVWDRMVIKPNYGDGSLAYHVDRRESILGPYRDELSQKLSEWPCWVCSGVEPDPKSLHDQWVAGDDPVEVVENSQYR